MEYQGCGVEYGTDWIVRDILREHLAPANTLEAFEQSVAECYAEVVEIGWIKVDVDTAIKELDPVSWNLAHSEFVDSEIADGNLVTFDNGATHYWAHEVEQMIEELSGHSPMPGD